MFIRKKSRSNGKKVERKIVPPHGHQKEKGRKRRNVRNEMISFDQIRTTKQKNGT